MDIDKQFWQTFQKFSGEVGESFNLSLFPEIIESTLKDSFGKYGVKEQMISSPFAVRRNVAQNNFQHFSKTKILILIITTLYQLMQQSWFQKTAQSLVNTSLSFSGQYRLP